MAREFPGGSPEHIPTEETKSKVISWYSAGVPQGRIAEHLSISEVTLRKYYREELDLCVDNMTSKLAKNLYQEAVGGDKTAREFWLKTRGKWSYARPPEETAEKEKMQSLLEKLIDKLQPE